MTLVERLKSKDPKVRAKAAGDLAAAAASLGDAARTIRDRDARELLRAGERPAEVGRTIGLHRAQMTRFSASDAEPARHDVVTAANTVQDEYAALRDLLEQGELAAAQ